MGVKDSASDVKEPGSPGIALLEISLQEFQAIRDLVYERFGIKLGDEKRSLVVGRLQKALHQKKFSTFKEYYDYVVNDESGQALEELASRISTNHTFFYRESDHFEFFRDRALPEIKRRHANDKDIRIWCAGCATGEEPYTLVMLLLESFGMEYSSWHAGLLATDISSRALAVAREGVYNDDRVEPLPQKLREKYFKPLAADQWAVVDRVKKEVTFRSLNLMNERFPFKKQFDAVFCRNVMIYFDQPTRDALVRRFYDCTVPGGYLFIGHSESLRRDTTPYEYVMPALYRKREN